MQNPIAKRARLDMQNKRREKETADQRATRLDQRREHYLEIVSALTPEQYQARISQARQNMSQLRQRVRADIETFEETINTFCNETCEVCTKKCYPTQIVSCQPSPQALEYFPNELKRSEPLRVCHRCKTHITSKKTMWPSKAYWNNLDPGVIPDEILQLSKAEQGLLARVTPYVKIIHLPGRFGQYGFRGQAVLFAQDLFEVTEKLPHMLPRSTSDSQMMVVTSHLENLNITREYTVSRTRLNDALQWLIDNNPLYKDVVIDHDVRLNQNDLIREQQAEEESGQNQETSAYKEIGTSSRILRASWHQGNESMFTSGYAGVQCAAMVLANIVRAVIIPPNQWTKLMLDGNMIAGDEIYTKIRNSSNRNLDVNGHLDIRDFNNIRGGFQMFENSFNINYAPESPFFGSLRDSVNAPPSVGQTLMASLQSLFESHSSGVLIAESLSLGVMHYNDRYYFTDSHSCGARGVKAGDGKACIIECDNITELVRICKRATGSANKPYTLDFIDVHLTNGTIIYSNDCEIPIEEPLIQMSQFSEIPVLTSVMGPIDCVQPDVEEELEVSESLNEIVRKTRDNLVNEAHEWKSEEFAWYYLFPNGVNGLKDQRPVKITPLDYYQFRILGSDTRFQSNAYLFYALSFFEYYRVKSTIAACGKKIEGPDGKVEDVHLYVRNLRGSSAYWRSAMNELIAQIRCLGPPTYFLTFSCNDLNWLDMRKALLIADGRPNEDPASLDMFTTQILIEKYPVIVSRHFMIRVKALMRILKNNTDVFGGKMVDYWWRVEFQVRGSPHLHMVVWIEDHPSFDTPEGIEKIDRNCSCEIPEEGSDLYELVMKSQIHRHTHTCSKNDPNSNVCRFSFPRQVCEETKIVAHSSDEFIRSGGRICILKRRQQDKWVNNYNPTLLKLWKGNMDIQPCGSNEAIAHYIAKYMSKPEPTTLDRGVAQAIQQIRREETNISRKLFKICMKILGQRQISACEAVFRLAHLNMKESSRKTVFLNTRKPEQRYKMLQFDQHGHASGYCSNIFNRYEQRPDTHPKFDFDNMSLIEFAMLFEPHYRKQDGDNEESIDYDPSEEEFSTTRTIVRLKDDTRMVLRTRPAVIQVPFFMAANDPENYYYSFLVQYMPYRQERELIEDYDSGQEAFIAREERLKEISKYMETYRERDKQLQNAFNQVHAFEILAEGAPIEEEPYEEEIPEVGMTDDQFVTAQRAMNVGQRELFIHITQSIQDQMNGSTDRERLFITGGAGTGKTFVFNLLKNQVNRCYGKIATKSAALTGVAARLVGGMTLHSILKLPVEKNGRTTGLAILTGNVLRTMRMQWKDIEFLFIDEISMVSYQVLCMIDSRLKQLKNNDELFGGINVLLFGDLMQLPPIRANQVFEQPTSMRAAIHLWRIFTLVELTQNMRQEGDTTFIDILNALRVGELQPHHMAVLISKVGNNFTGEFSIEKALRIRPHKKTVAAHNQQVLDHFRSIGTEMFMIRAQDTLVDATRNEENIDMERAVPKDIDNTAGLPKELEIFVGAKVMLRINMDVQKGLVNGAMGFISEIIWPLFHRGQLHDYDIPSVRIDFGRDGIHTIKPVSKQFPANYSYGTIERRMLPLILSWASTAHKMQGSTVDYAVLDLGSDVFADGQAYVMLSRVRSLDGVLIEKLECEKLTGKKPCNKEALKEMERLRAIARD
ncbi:unnamed protein product [Chironomus riparius]|uniref:ATP-dependent DNA helicase n=1 Tax=Chironomus riparius TaxID=315576 RepID=A0A9N9RM32_9DIPT|nr:unnamed protein product [Chironomus riparius]